MLTYGERLTSFTSAWPHASPSPQDLAEAGFSYRPTSELLDSVICQLCNTQLYDWEPADDPMQEHYRCSKSCIKLAEGDSTLLFVQDAMALPQKVAQASVQADLSAPQKAPQQKAPQPSPKNIGFLDPSLQHDFPDLCLFHNTHVFCDRIEQCRSQFGEADILAILPRCLRGEALKWFKQSECQDLATCILAMKARFPQASQQAPQQASSQAAPQEPPQEISQIACQALEYHHCKLCNASFSSMARLIRHAQGNICDKPSCRHCDMVFSSKNRLHQHLREKCLKQTRSSSASSRSSSSPSPTWSSTWSSPSSTACSSTCSPKSSPAPSPAPSPPPRYRAISPSPSNYLTVADLSARYAKPPCLNVDDLFRMFRGSSATTRSSTIPTSAQSSTPAAPKHPSIRHRGRCLAKKGDGSTKPPKHQTKHLTKQQQNQKQKIGFARTPLQQIPYELVLPLQRSRSVSCPMAAPGSPSSFTRAPPQSSPLQCIRSPMPHT